MKKALLSVAMAAVISLSATAVSSTVVGAVSSNLATPKISKTENVNGGVKLTWSKVKGAEKYRVYYKGSKGWTRMVDTTSTSYIDKDVSSGRNYTYTVRCINSSATKFTSGYDSKGKSVKYISAPKITKAESVDGGVKISWNKSNGAEKYRVYYKGSKGWTRMVDTTSTSYIDKDVSSGKNYTYTVRCINSSATKFTSGYDSKGKFVKYISAPKITKAESVDGGVKISWNKSSGAEQYRVYYKGRKGWTRMVDTTSTSYIDKDVSSGKNYTYTVRCLNKSKNKFTSGYNSTGKSIKYVSAPKISKTEATYNSVNLNWDKVNGAEKYRVYRRGEKGWTRLFDTTSTTFTDTNLYADTEYTYTVRCINSSANKFTSGYNSKGFTVTTLSAPAEHTHTWQNITKETQVKVVDKKAYTYEEPIYEKHDRTICNRCGADITDNLEHIFECNSNYHNEWRDIQVGTKTVTVPEKSHYETKTEVVGRKCTVCGKVEMFSEEHTHTWQDITKKVPYTESVTKTEYVEKVRTICNDCGADITGNTEHIFDEIEKGGKGSYRAEKILVPIEKTETVTKTKTEVVGRKCTECGEIEYY
jgi:thymidine kinase